MKKISSIKNRKRLVFADKKPFKEIDIFGRVRRDVKNGDTPPNKTHSSSRNRYNILCAINIKGGDVPPVDYAVIDACTNSAIFIQFVAKLIEKGSLVRGDVFVVDNCTVHNKGDNIGLEGALHDVHGVQLIMLPPYHPDFNPTELVFNTLLQRLNSEKARYNSIDAEDFLDAIKNTLNNIDLLDVINFYKHQGYLH